jgi:hypothetical protein
MNGLFFRADGCYQKIDFASILYVEASGNYSKIVTHREDLARPHFPRADREGPAAGGLLPHPPGIPREHDPDHHLRQPPCPPGRTTASHRPGVYLPILRTNAHRGPKRRGARPGAPAAAQKSSGSAGKDGGRRRMIILQPNVEILYALYFKPHQ